MKKIFFDSKTTMEDQIDWKKIKAMKPYIRILGDGRYEASVGTGFETCWWPEGVGATLEEAIKNLNKELAKKV